MKAVTRPTKYMYIDKLLLPKDFIRVCVFCDSESICKIHLQVVSGLNFNMYSEDSVLTVHIHMAEQTVDPDQKLQSMASDGGLHSHSSNSF